MYNFDKKYIFNRQWFDINVPLWTELFSQYDKDNIESVLEIGCYEGRSTVWLCENVLNINTKRYEYHTIDKFEQPETDCGPNTISIAEKKDQNIVERNFRHNISFFNNIEFNIHKGLSSSILPKLETTFDLIYIDGSHKSDDTFVDAYYSSKLLNTNGLLIFDDFGWKDPNNSGINDSPELGIKLFIQLNSDKYHIVHVGYQVVLMKK